ncbi:hypothetical protein F4703DRAFT_1799846 [Phycomyces blakesleeanus]|uniref:Uncharacterized protein n=1 Tax=Phycomyces blakesleeanus (strain ATCC 8743b / DSM 1359 / FGSC 10004 / NBRC 33097 / NRRL 1555) TaxID=763407 RepID=A0A162TK13_PHYB8|nr:hypothetical protein PHYBLDRAFT_172457 [Phycomyces blakesleeanus NRRL 1555(-)]OAD69202.1 hypothetical protein PHYBLDRAFT_172457 [Phycomyces blakesleeanus NRRL 1555(-)]|eukprot:XP_018287242.1 hypothetical protein PHYBLDRAFT_172457 [Phycomyces blakesleeanus NRRL 1555(-)]
MTDQKFVFDNISLIFEILCTLLLRYSGLLLGQYINIEKVDNLARFISNKEPVPGCGICSSINYGVYTKNPINRRGVQSNKKSSIDSFTSYITVSVLLIHKKIRKPENYIFQLKNMLIEEQKEVTIAYQAISNKIMSVFFWLHLMTMYRKEVCYSFQKFFFATCVGYTLTYFSILFYLLI